MTGIYQITADYVSQCLRWKYLRVDEESLRDVPPGKRKDMDGEFSGQVSEIFFQ